MRSATQNNGKITSQTDNISGEQVIYAYDALNRLASAGATSGTWGQSYSYDGFGNLQNETVTAGTAPSLSVVYNASNNRQTSDCADANGNIFGNIAGGGSCGSISPSYSYDVTNRIASAAGGVQYGYAAGNKRVWKGITTNGNLTQDTITFWSVTGQKLGDYGLTGDPSVVYSWNNYNSYPTPAITFALSTANYYFGGKQIAKVQWQVPWSQTWPFNNTVTYAGSDRLGSFGKYYPWGQEKPSATANNTEKFTGYFRDSETGLDYAVNRYHQPGIGRFVSVDPYQGSAGPTAPGSWNRYAYTDGDPVNRLDTQGLDMVNSGDWDPSQPCGGQLCIAQGTFNSYNPFGDPLGQAYSQYVNNVQTQFAYNYLLVTYTAPPVPLSGGSQIVIQGLVGPYGLVTANSGTQEFVTSTFTPGSLVYPDVYAPPIAAPPNPMFDPSTEAYTASFGGFGAWGVVGGTVNVAYIPGSNTWCGGVSFGVGTAGYSGNLGGFSSNGGIPVQNVIEGFSLNASVNSPVLLGAQGSWSPGTGTGSGLTVGTPGASLTAGGSLCGQF